MEAKYGHQEKLSAPSEVRIEILGIGSFKKENLLFDPWLSYSQSAEEMEQSVTSARSWPYSLPLSPETGIMI
jgi:hypothetical protein